MTQTPPPVRSGALVTVRFVSGASRDVSPRLLPRIVGLSGEGRIVVDDGFGYLFGLTLCHNAYDKGGEDGVYCRICYGPDRGEYDAVVTDPVSEPATA